MRIPYHEEYHTYNCPNKTIEAYTRLTKYNL